MNKKFEVFKILSGMDELDRLLEAKKILLRDLVDAAVEAYCIYGDIDDLKENKQAYMDAIGFSFQWAYRTIHTIIEQNPELHWLSTNYSKFINYVANEYISLRKKVHGQLIGSGNQAKIHGIINKSSLYDYVSPKQDGNKISSRMLHIMITISGEAPTIVNSKSKATIDAIRLSINKNNEWIAEIAYTGNYTKPLKIDSKELKNKSTPTIVKEKIIAPEPTSCERQPICKVFSTEKEAVDFVYGNLPVSQYSPLVNCHPNNKEKNIALLSAHCSKNWNGNGKLMFDVITQACVTRPTTVDLEKMIGSYLYNNQIPTYIQ